MHDATVRKRGSITIHHFEGGGAPSERGESEFFLGAIGHVTTASCPVAHGPLAAYLVPSLLHFGILRIRFSRASPGSGVLRLRIRQTSSANRLDSGQRERQNVLR